MKFKLNFGDRQTRIKLGLILFNILAIPLTVLAVVKYRSYMIKAAQFEAKLLLNPNNSTSPTGINLLPGQRQKVDVLINSHVGTDPAGANINGVEFKITYDAAKVKIVDSAGASVSSITVGTIFDGKGPFVAQNSVGGNEIYLSMLGTTGTFNGESGLVASFYVEPLVTGGSSDLIFVSVTDGSASDFMHAYQKTASPPYPDILYASTMNGTGTSSLKINFSAAAAPTLSLVTANNNINQGDTFTVNLNIDTTDKNIIGADALLSFDPAMLTLTGFTHTTEIFTNYENTDLTVLPVLISGWSMSAWQGSNTMAELQFQANQSALGATEVSLVFDGYQASTADSNILTFYEAGTGKTTSDDILQTVNSLSLNIVAPSPSPVPPSPSPVPPSPSPVPPSPSPVPPSPSPVPPSPSPVPPSPSPVPPSPSPVPPSPSPSPVVTPPPNRCAVYPADVNADNNVDSTDLSIMVSGWGTKYTTLPVMTCSRDLNTDNIVNVADIQILVSWWLIKPYWAP